MASKQHRPEPEPLWTVKDIARILGCSTDAVYERIAYARKHGLQTIPYTRVGPRSLFFVPRDVKAYLAHHSRGQLALNYHPGDELPPEDETK